MNMNKISKRSTGLSLKTRRAWKPGQLLLRRSWHRLRVLSYWINRKPENFVLLARKINSLRKGETRGRDHLRQTHCTRLTSLKQLIKICQQCSHDTITFEDLSTDGLFQKPHYSPLEIYSLYLNRPLLAFHVFRKQLAIKLDVLQFSWPNSSSACDYLLFMNMFLSDFHG